MIRNIAFTAAVMMLFSGCATITPAEVAPLSTGRLCTMWHAKVSLGRPTDVVRDELVRRDEVRTEMVRLIDNGEAVVGMNSTELQCAWGAPSSINRIIYAGGSTEQWVYARYLGRETGYLYSFAYVKNGAVCALQD